MMNAHELGLVRTEERVVVSSLDVAKNFEKQHQHVLRDIRNLECSEEFSQSNFGLAEYKDEQGKPRPSYLITRDGFAFLAMGFTGKKAAKFKEAYITAFNEMERCLKPTPAAIDYHWLAITERIGDGNVARPLVHEFVVKCCDSVQNILTSRFDFYKALTHYCAMLGEVPPTRCAAVRAMNELAYYNMYRSCSERYWKGLRILPPQMWKR